MCPPCYAVESLDWRSGMQSVQSLQDYNTYPSPQRSDDGEQWEWQWFALGLARHEPGSSPLVWSGCLGLLGRHALSYSCRVLRTHAPFLAFCLWGPSSPDRTSPGRYLCRSKCFPGTQSRHVPAPQSTVSRAIVTAFTIITITINNQQKHCGVPPGTEVSPIL